MSTDSISLPPSRIIISMINDMHSKPGDDILSSMGGYNPIAPKDIFRKPSAGGVPRRPKPANEDVPTEEALKPLEPAAGEGDGAQSNQEKGKEVELSQLKWSLEKGTFNEKVTAVLQAKLAPGREHLTRLSITLFALDPEGKRERIDAKETHIHEGRAEQEFTLYYPQFMVDGNLPTECNYIFTAKHRDSKEHQSPELTVRKKSGSCVDFKQRLLKAVGNLKNVGFGRAEGGKEVQDQSESVDDAYWIQNIELYKGEEEGVVELKAGKSYSEALEKIIERPGQWSFDCMQFVQVALLYALVDPKDKKGFDSRLPGVKRIRTFPSMEQKPFESTGLEAKIAYERASHDAAVHEYPTMRSIGRNMSDILKEAPIGTRATWTCLDAGRAFPAFSFENAIKIGPDAFSGHPFYGQMGALTEEKMVRELAKIIYPDLDFQEFGEKIRTRIFLSHVTIFKTPCS